LALNVDCDLAPFARIEPCGYRGLEVTSMAREGAAADAADLGAALTTRLAAALDARAVACAGRGGAALPRYSGAALG
jgi:lipoyl(octanoyl) transferase